MNQKRVLIVGCGYVGTALARKLVLGKNKVWALRRSAEALKRLAKEGIEPVPADVLSDKSALALPEVDAALISLAPAESSPEAYEAIYLKAVARVLAALRARPPKRLIYLSSTRVYGQKDGRWVDEQTPPAPVDPQGAILLKAENAVLNSKLPALVFRLGGIYGPGRNRFDAVQSGKTVSGDADGYMNLIHREDVASAAIHLFEKGTPGEVYLGVDDEPVRRKMFYAWLGAKLNLPEQNISNQSAKIPRAETNKRCRNDKLKALGYAFQFPTFREGYGAMIRETSVDKRVEITEKSGVRPVD